MTGEIEPVEMQLEVIEPTALESIERANVDIQISTARKYPRKLALVKQRMLNLATLDEETAASCFYKLNRQGKAIEGPSIRLAEIAASSFGNLRYGARVVANNGKQIVAQGFCHDLETNVLSTIEVQRRITDRNGKPYSDDMQVVTGNAACAIAARNSIFKVVPFAFVKPIFLAAKQAAVGDITTLAERRTKMLQRFAALGVNEKRIYQSLGKSGAEEIGLGELETLIGLYTSVRDGDQSVEEAFPLPSKSSEDIKFGPSGIEVPEQSATEEKPKRKRRTKAEMEAAAQGVEKPAATEMPPRATPLEGLRNLLMASPINEAQLRAYLIGNMIIEPSEKLDDLPDEKLQNIINDFEKIAHAILDKEE